MYAYSTVPSMTQAVHAERVDDERIITSNGMAVVVGLRLHMCILFAKNASRTPCGLYVSEEVCLFYDTVTRHRLILGHLQSSL